jgi:hypothetical protein
MCRALGSSPSISPGDGLELGLWLRLSRGGTAGGWVRPHLWELGIRMAPSSPVQPVFGSRKVNMRPPILLSASRMVT